MNTFRYNGFTITVLSDRVIASQAGFSLTFSSLEKALQTLSSV